MAYTEITIVAPSSASPGETVPVTITVKNVDPVWDHNIWTLSSAPFLGDTIINEIELIRSGQTRSYSASFKMPSEEAIIRVFTYYPTGPPTVWHLDNHERKYVSLVEAFIGTISRKELEYNGARASIPGYNIPQGERGLVHIWGHNDMATSQKLAIHWVVKDPDGVIVEDYEDWEFGRTGPGDDHPFIGGRFDIDKPGVWTIAVGLFMNPTSPVEVDSYSGLLCSVAAAVPEPEFRNFSVSKYQTV